MSGSSSTGTHPVPPFDVPASRVLRCNGARATTSNERVRENLERTGPGAPGDRDLLDGARQGSREAMEELVLRHQGRVFAVLRRCVAPDEVEDMAQEAFLRAFAQIGRFRGEAQFGTWLFRIVRNLLIDRQRRRMRAPGRIGLADETGDPDDARPADPGPTPAEALQTARRDARLATALAKLGEVDRLALLLHDQEGFDAGEVARVVGGSAGAVRIRLFRARRKVRKWMEEDVQ